MKIRIPGTGLAWLPRTGNALAKAIARTGRIDAQVDREDDESIIQHHIPRKPCWAG